MTDPRPANVPWLTPSWSYATRAAIEFFKAAFGFTVRDVHDEDGAIMHVEMAYRGQLIVMFAPEGAFGSPALTPKVRTPPRRNRSTCMSTTSTPPGSARSTRARSR